MSTFTSRLGLKKPDGTDPFLASDFRDNFDLLDTAPGIHICTSTSRPAWGAAETGRSIYELDTLATWFWTGGAFHDSSTWVHAFHGYNAPNLTIPRLTAATITTHGPVLIRKPGALQVTTIVNARVNQNDAQEVTLETMVDGVSIGAGGANRESIHRTLNVDQPGFHMFTMISTGQVGVMPGMHTLQARVAVSAGPESVLVYQARSMAVLGSLTR